MDLIKAQAMLANAELIHSEATVQAAVADVAAAIRERLADKYPLVLCVMTGGVVFSGQLLTKLDFPLDFDYLHATRYGPETQGGKISWRSAPWTSVKGRSVLVVDDILDEGGLTVPDRFVFGFGMDAGGVWRNLPAVYAMKDDDA